MGVGNRKPEQPVALVGRPDHCRTEDSSRNPIAQPFHILGDAIEAEGQMSGDVFAEDQRRPCLSDDSRDMGPQVARIVFTKSTAGGRERLARVARSNDIHDSAPRAAVEGSDVGPDRRLRYGLVLHARCQYASRICLPLDMTDRSIPWHSKGDSEFEPGDA